MDTYQVRKTLNVKTIKNAKPGILNTFCSCYAFIKHKSTKPFFVSMHPIGSAGAIATSATDMAKWIKFNLKLGQTETGKQLLDKKLMQDMRKATTPIVNEQDIAKPEFPVDFITSAYGYAWFVAEYRGITDLHPTGHP